MKCFLCVIVDGDIIEIDIPARTINVRLTDEELAARAVWDHRACHGEDAQRVLEVIFEAVMCKLTADRVSRAAHAGSVRAAALDHKAADDSVEDQTVIITFLHQ